MKDIVYVIAKHLNNIHQIEKRKIYSTLPASRRAYLHLSSGITAPCFGPYSRLTIDYLRGLDPIDWCFVYMLSTTTTDLVGPFDASNTIPQWLQEIEKAIENFWPDEVTKQDHFRSIDFIKSMFLKTEASG